MSKTNNVVTIDCNSLDEKVDYINMLLDENGGRFYRVKMLKEDNSVRDMICGKPARSGIKGTGSKLKDQTTVRVSECFNGYRSWNKLRVLEMKMSGVLYQFRFKAHS